MKKQPYEWRGDMSYTKARLYVVFVVLLSGGSMLGSVLFGGRGPRPAWLLPIAGVVSLLVLGALVLYASKREYSIIDLTSRTVRVGSTGLGASERSWPWSAFRSVIVPDPFVGDPNQMTKTWGVVLCGDERVRVDVPPTVYAARRAALELAELMGLPFDPGTGTGARPADALRMPLRWRLLRSPVPTGSGPPSPRMATSVRRDRGGVSIQPWEGRGPEVWVDPTGVYCRADERAPWSAFPAECIDDVWVMTEVDVSRHSNGSSSGAYPMTYRVELGLADGQVVPLRWGGLTGSAHKYSILKTYEMECRWIAQAICLGLTVDRGA